MKGPWIIGGDFNMTPSELEDSGWLETVKGVVVAPAPIDDDDRAIDFLGRIAAAGWDPAEDVGDDEEAAE